MYYILITSNTQDKLLVKKESLFWLTVLNRLTSQDQACFNGLAFSEAGGWQGQSLSRKTITGQGEKREERGPAQLTEASLSGELPSEGKT